VLSGDVVLRFVAQGTAANDIVSKYALVAKGAPPATFL
jgi:hypothetical protein